MRNPVWVMALIYGLPLIFALFYPRTLAVLPGLGALAGWAYFKWAHGDNLQWQKLAFLIPAFALCFALITLPVSSHPAEAFERLIKMMLVLCPGIVLISLSCQHAHLAKPFFPFMMAAFVLGLSLLLADYLLGLPLYRLSRLIPAVADIEAYELNRSAVFFSLLLWPIGGMLWQQNLEKWKKKILFLLFLLLCGAVAVLTESQSVALGLLAGAGGFGLTLLSVKAARYFISAAVIFLMLGMPWLVQFGFANVAHVMNWEILGADLQLNIARRTEVWDYTARHALDHFWFGQGLEATRYVEGFDTQELYQPGHTILHPHNFVLQIWMEFGVFGALVATSVLLILINCWSKLSKSSACVSFSLFSALFAIGCVGYGLWQGWWLGALIFITALAALVICQPSERRT